MLTVMHRHNDGTETLYQAQSVRRENGGTPSIPPSGDVILTGAPDSGPTLYGGPGAHHEGEGMIRISPRFFATEGGTEHAGLFDESTVFVMNRFGATVARYHLGPPPRAPKAAESN